MPAMASRTAITAAASAATQPHTESPSPRGQHVGEASLLMRRDKEFGGPPAREKKVYVT